MLYILVKSKSEIVIISEKLSSPSRDPSKNLPFFDKVSLRFFLPHRFPYSFSVLSMLCFCLFIYLLLLWMSGRTCKYVASPHRGVKAILND